MLDKIQCAYHAATHVSSLIVSALNFIQQDFNSLVLWSFPPSPLVSPQRFQSHLACLSVARTGWTPSSSRAFNLPSYVSSLLVGVQGEIKHETLLSPGKLMPWHAT